MSMKHVRLILGAVVGLTTLAACAGGGSPAGATPSGTPASQTIHVVEPAKNFSQVSVGSLTGCTNAAGCQGDYILGDDSLYDATTGDEVGRFLFECFNVDPATKLFHCPGNTIALTGRGQITYTEDVHFAAGYPLDVWPITGGTGEFLGVKGTVTSPADSTYTDGGDFVITIVN